MRKKINICTYRSRTFVRQCPIRGPNITSAWSEVVWSLILSHQFGKSSRDTKNDTYFNKSEAGAKSEAAHPLNSKSSVWHMYNPSKSEYIFFCIINYIRLFILTTICIWILYNMLLRVSYSIDSITIIAPFFQIFPMQYWTSSQLGLQGRV